MPGRITNTDRALVLLGDGWFADVPVADACAILDRRLAAEGRAPVAAAAMPSDDAQLGFGDGDGIVNLVEEYGEAGDLVASTLPRYEQGGVVPASLPDANELLTSLQRVAGAAQASPAAGGGLKSLLAAVDPDALAPAAGKAVTPTAGAAARAPPPASVRPPASSASARSTVPPPRPAPGPPASAATAAAPPPAAVAAARPRPPITAVKSTVVERRPPAPRPPQPPQPPRPRGAGASSNSGGAAGDSRPPPSRIAQAPVVERQPVRPPRPPSAGDHKHAVASNFDAKDVFQGFPGSSRRARGSDDGEAESDDDDDVDVDESEDDVDMDEVAMELERMRAMRAAAGDEFYMP